jgi:hypothetical protein
MKAIVVTDQAAGTAGMQLVERPEPQPSINDVVVQVHASGFVGTELAWPSTWTDRLDRDRTPSIPGHELAGVVTALGYGTTGLSVGQRVFGLTDWYRDGTLAAYAAVEARNLAPLPDDVDFALGASLPISGLTAWQGLIVHGRLQAGERVIAHGAAGAVGSMVAQLAREFGAYVIGTGRAADRQTALDFGANEFVDLDNQALEDVGEVDLVFDLIGARSGSDPRAWFEPEERWCPLSGRPRCGPPTAWRSTSSSKPIAPNSTRSSSECETGDCGQTSVSSQPSTMPSPPLTRPSGSMGRRSFAFVRETKFLARVYRGRQGWVESCHRPDRSTNGVNRASWWA